MFLPRLEEGDLPVRQAKEAEEVNEERRLLYVGLTRAKRVLVLTWAGKRSRFLTELGIVVAAPPRPVGASAAGRSDGDRELLDSPLGTALRTWRLARARLDAVPAYVVFSDRTLMELAAQRPATLGELAGISGIGPAKLERFGADVLDVVAGRVGASA